MKTKRKSFLSVILVFVMIFSSLGVFAVESDVATYDYEVNIDGYKYFSDGNSDYKLSKVKLNDKNEEVEGTLEEVLNTSGSAIHLVTNYDEVHNKDNKYFYYFLDDNNTGDNNDSGIYKFDTTNNDDDYQPEKITVNHIVDIGDIDDSFWSIDAISEMVLTKNNNGKDVIFFVEPNLDTNLEEGLLCRLIIDSDNDNILTFVFEYDGSDDSDGIFEVKDIYIKDNFLHFTHFINGEEIPRQMDINNNKVIDIPLEHIEIKKEITDKDGNFILDKIENGTLKLYKGEKVTLVADMTPQNPSYKDLSWELQSNDFITKEPASSDSTKITLKVLPNAEIGSITNVIVLDKTEYKLATLNIIIVEKQNILKKVTFADDKMIYIDKDDSKEFELKLVGEDGADITDLEAAIESIEVGPKNNDFITVDKVIKDGKAFIKITGKKITARGEEPKAFITIKDNIDFRFESQSIVVEEIVKPNIKIRPSVLKDNDRISIELEQNNSLDFELAVEEDGKFSKLDASKSGSIKWSIENSDLITISKEKVPGVEVTIDAKKVGTTTLKTEYEYDTGKVVSAEFNITVIEDEYGDYDRWTGKDTPTSVSPNKVWTIKFNQPLDESTINSRNIYIKKRINSNYDVLFDDTITYLGDDDKTLKIKPTRSYPPGEYFLYIESSDDDKDKNRSIRNIYGGILHNSIKMRFTVK